MALPPQFAGQLLNSHLKSSPAVKHSLEIYLDYTCPFSAKMFNTIHTSVAPLLSHDAEYGTKVNLIFRQLIQPWHPSSTLTHEAAAAVLRVAPWGFWHFSAALFRRQEQYFDVLVLDETRSRTYERLAKLAGEHLGSGIEGEVLELLKVDGDDTKQGGLNRGNGVTGDIKQMVKAARVVGVHVSPTVFFDGVEEKSISSGFTKEQWEEWLKKNAV